MGMNSAISILIRSGAAKPRTIIIHFLKGARVFIFSKASRPAVGAHPASSVATGGFFPQRLCGNGVNLMTQVHVIYGKCKNACSCVLTPVYPLMM